MGSTANTDYPVKHPSIPSLMNYGGGGGGQEGGGRQEGGSEGTGRGAGMWQWGKGA